MPASTKNAIVEARENRQHEFVCIGGSKAELFSEILDVGFDELYHIFVKYGWMEGWY
ncbi:hypothetical protein Pryu01_01837 [Paraliobacillus ryukyuensis]|uniref:Uncharacterized protein n=1 Tax=Paraliobacillus ryukyuensis TaxID=200904 RepID=A0A366DSX3_9BACI|nr:hypothetical protein [Paraliobacillus ryukyuensis]RBO93197.1 hypothetical protein DES48_11363 [Paraliobacillus ryukyuensis]